jgi:hypothetical protein
MPPDAYLEAHHDIAVRVGDLDRVERREQTLFLALAHEDAPREPEDPGERNVEVGENPARRPFDDVLAKAGEVAGPGAACVHKSGHGAAPRLSLSVDAEGCSAPIDVGVEIDETRHHQLPRHIAN